MEDLTDVYRPRLVVSSQNAGNTTAADNHVLAMTAPGSPSVLPVPENPDVLPQPTPARYQAPNRVESGREAAAALWRDVNQKGTPGWREV